MHPGCRRVHPASLGFWGVPWGSSGSSGVLPVSPDGLGVPSESLCTCGYNLGDSSFIRDRWVPWGAPFGLSGSSGVALFILVRPWGGNVHPGSLSTLGCALGLSGSFGVTGFIAVCPGGRLVPSGSLRSFGYALEVVGFIQGR